MNPIQHMTPMQALDFAPGVAEGGAVLPFVAQSCPFFIEEEVGG